MRLERSSSSFLCGTFKFERVGKWPCQLLMNVTGGEPNMSICEDIVFLGGELDVTGLALISS
jgi:hypothetical protein